MQLERLTGVEIYSAVVGFSGSSIASINNHAIVSVGNQQDEISWEDKERVLQSAQNIALPPDRTIMQIIERQYIIDGYDGIKDPVGMAGSRLEVEIALVVSATVAIQNLYKSTQRINLPVAKICYNPLLVAETVLFPTEKEMGVVLVNLGGGTTNISFFQMGSLLHTSVLPIGGDYITQDLAIVLRTSFQEAERIKREYGVVNPEIAKEDDDQVTIQNMQGTGTKQVSVGIIEEIISARIYEIIELIYAQFNRFAGTGKIPGGIVLTGGGAHLKGINKVMEDYLDLPVRIGYPDNIINLPPEYRDPQYASVLGAVKCGASYVDISYQKAQGLAKVVDRISYFLKDLFS